ncbi:MAG: DUF4114 domain-containing protein [Rhodospirillales bacterium]|nr:DUF4114 domain-containing protein [Rhodospirillales bacterium]
MKSHKSIGWLVGSVSLLIGSNAFAADAPDIAINIDLTEGLLSTIDSELPERSNADASFLDYSYSPNISPAAPAQLGVTFLSEGAGYRNSLGYFTFQNDTFSNLTFGDIDTDQSGNVSVNEISAVNGVSWDMVFDNVSASGSGGSLLAGDTVVLGNGSATASTSDSTMFEMSDGRVFETGTNVGFFLMQNAWTGSEVKGIDTNDDPLTFYSLDFLNPENTADATIDNAGENSRHVAMMFADNGQDELIMAFEDLKRPYGDNDFNDAVFRIRSDPIGALSNTEVYQAAPSPALGAGIPAVLGMVGFFVMSRRNRPEGGSELVAC